VTTTAFLINFVIVALLIPKSFLASVVVIKSVGLSMAGHLSV
jgi:hypothetical protein